MVCLSSGSTAAAMILLTRLLLVAACSPSPSVSLVHSYSLGYTDGLPAADRFEHVHLVAALSGIVNRDSPRLFTPLLVTGAPGGGVDSGSTADDTWLSHLRAQGEWLAETVIVNVTSLPDLIQLFKPQLKGFVVYDPHVPATSNLASTAAGVEGLLPICYNTASTSLYSQVVLSERPLPVILNLTGMFSPGTVLHDAAGSSKIAAYRWGRSRWLSPNSSLQCNPAKLGYYVDYWAALQGDRLGASPGLTEVANHDYFVAHKAFFFDLSVWADEAPVDDPTQPLGADREELIAVFADAYALTQAEEYSGEEMIHVGGFTPWWYKYTQDGPGCPKCKHKGVETEWETMGVIGAYNAFDDGDACCVGAMANAAFYQHYPLNASFHQNRKPSVSDLHARGLVATNGTVVSQPYAAYYAGDYDGAAWLYNQLKEKWDDRKRGQVPIGWAIDSELSMRFPVIFKYLYQTRTPNDWFISGDSGAGYLNPTLLLPDPKTKKRGVSNVSKSGGAAWIRWNTKWYRQFDLSFTGFLINGDQGELSNESIALYDSFSPDGVVVTTGHDPHQATPGDLPQKENGGAWCSAGGTPVMHHVTDLPGGNATVAGGIIANIVKADQQRSDLVGMPTFYFLRTILQPASFMVEAAEIAAQQVPVVFVDPYTMGLLVKCASHQIDCRA